MNHHYRPHIPPHRPPPPRPPPPPPEAVATDQDNTGRPRCYYCGQVIAREEDVRKTEHQLGHGYTTLVMICPDCRGKKERGEGPFRPKIGKVLIPVLLFAGFGLFVLFMVNGLPFISRGTIPANKSGASGGLTL